MALVPCSLDHPKWPKMALRDHIRDHNWAENVAPYEVFQKKCKSWVGFAHSASSRPRRKTPSVVWMTVLACHERSGCCRADRPGDPTTGKQCKKM